ncbi:MAG: hypothetical protein AVDCRST_MAG26-3523 [uncultured Chloroflexia bacterium]|uniref:Uncharacterized protein n=1 Tax=uncultured Chloroflexia bacterium TaxID=1672391 RepID=A0A6J4JNQ1_9CHLR|nr:MAG: hypothetical protein AVDCRST_MAG26-3523 [uncultured Chloroflexia bacterium]
MYHAHFLSGKESFFGTIRSQISLHERLDEAEAWIYAEYMGTTLPVPQLVQESACVDKSRQP